MVLPHHYPFSEAFGEAGSPGARHGSSPPRAEARSRGAIGAERSELALDGAAGTWHHAAAFAISVLTPSPESAKNRFFGEDREEEKERTLAQRRKQSMRDDMPDQR